MQGSNVDYQVVTQCYDFFFDSQCKPVKLKSMVDQQPTSAPPEFIRLLERSIRDSGLTKAQVAFKADISPAYLSRLLHGVRGVPADTILVRLEDVLDIQPRGRLFDAARRHDAVVEKVLKMEKGRILMRSLGSLTDEEMAIILSVADGFARKRQAT
jgi:transcriptional regulator with XRE-family HTH domain